MFCCDKFVFIHYPKTGGTFVESVLRELLNGLGEEYTAEQSHDTCREIPSTHQGLPILSCVRNPLDIRASGYNYRWWASDCDQSIQDRIRAMYSHYPELSFEEYIKAWDTCTPVAISHRKLNSFAATLGQYSNRFIRMFALNPGEMVAELNEERLAPEALRRNLYPVHFLHTRNLNKDLCLFLENIGYAPSQVEFVREHRKVLPRGGHPRPPSDHWSAYYTPELRDAVLQRERLIFNLFPEFRDDTSPSS